MDQHKNKHSKYKITYCTVCVFICVLKLFFQSFFFFLNYYYLENWLLSSVIPCEASNMKGTGAGDLSLTDNVANSTTHLV